MARPAESHPMAHRRPRGRIGAAIALLALVGTACGSTVPRALIDRALQGEPGLGPAPANSTIPGAAGTGVPGSGAVPTVGPNLGGVPNNGVAAQPGGTPLFGVTATTFFFGAFYQVNQGTANEAIGFGGLDSGDSRPVYKALIEDINAHGGLAERKIVPIFHRIDVASTETADQQDQRACNLFFQDNKVAVTSMSGAVIDECVKKAGAFNFGGAIAGGHSASLPATYTRYPHRVDISAMNMIRIGQVAVDGLARYGYFDPGAKIGIVTWDDAAYKTAVADGFLAALKRIGRSFGLPPAYARQPQTAQEIGQTSADIGAAVLRFKRENVTHVLILDGPAGACGGGCLTLEWLQQSQGQRFFPRYGLNDSSSARGLYEQDLLPARQLERSLSVGWTTLDASYDEGWRRNAVRDRCYDLMRRNNVEVGEDLNRQLTVLSACSELWFLQAAVNRIGGPLTQENLTASINSLAYTFQSPGSYDNYFGPSRHDGAAGIRVMRFDAGCGCFQYVTAPYRV